ncbi:methyltransferase domain-containing protein [Hymenobacter sp. BT683]|uniref:Methyltransferase domain-containing protein n=1 Tax=Hymenobacter jeongseonensis TaxID=2791027 RepID=A0ABS0ID30_9BACT|nr:class I SAM-dependent methyltransferase [Hymenobacter jeongseonensis]MBF9236248.1 methyltransferase domain-containing protein [Hymenobacter jeongseonensis]
MITTLVPEPTDNFVGQLPRVLPDPAGSPEAAPAHACRFCGAPLHVTFVDLGTSPLCQDHVRPENFNRAEAFYALHARVCQMCLLVQVGDLVSPTDVFPNDYAYFSSYSPSWLRHARQYTDMVVARYGLGPEHRVVEVASNDGYLLQYFVEKGLPVLGIEPAENVAAFARSKGINTLSKFFGLATAREVAASHGQADMLIGNNVLAHVPDINDFVAGLGQLLKPTGVLTMEFPHLLRLVAGNQFDTIYHEHFSYLSFWTVEHIFARHGLAVFDVEELPTHGGSLRIHARHTNCPNPALAVTPAVSALRTLEIRAGICTLEFYTGFAARVQETKRKLLTFLIEAKRAGKAVVGYGAPGKGNTLLNYCGIRTDFVDYTVDLSPHKQGNFLPGTRLPIYHPDHILETRPDYVLILPWNLREEIMEQMAIVRSWGGQFVVPIPEVTVYP